MEQNTLWLPDRYGVGTIIYDKDKKPYRVTKQITSGIYEIESIDEELAKEMISKGANVLVSK